MLWEVASSILVEPGSCCHCLPQRPPYLCRPRGSLPGQAGSGSSSTDFSFLCTRQGTSAGEGTRPALVAPCPMGHVLGSVFLTLQGNFTAAWLHLHLRWVEAGCTMGQVTPGAGGEQWRPLAPGHPWENPTMGQFLLVPQLVYRPWTHRHRTTAPGTCWLHLAA